LKHLTEFPLEDGTSILVEVEDQVPEGGLVQAARPGEVAERAGQTLEAALQKIKPMAEAVLTTLRQLAQRPDELHVEFGVKVSAQAGAVLASASLEGNYRITLTWRAPASAPDSPAVGLERLE
jgi:hypothetical protein